MKTKKQPIEAVVTSAVDAAGYTPRELIFSMTTGLEAYIQIMLEEDVPKIPTESGREITTRELKEALEAVNDLQRSLYRAHAAKRLAEVDAQFGGKVTSEPTAADVKKIRQLGVVIINNVDDRLSMTASQRIDDFDAIIGDAFHGDDKTGFHSSLGIPRVTPGLPSFLNKLRRLMAAGDNKGGENNNAHKQ